MLLVEEHGHLLEHHCALHSEGQTGAEVATNISFVEDTNEFVEAGNEHVDSVDDLSDGLDVGTERLSDGSKGVQTSLKHSELLGICFLIWTSVLIKLLSVVPQENARLETCEEVGRHLIFHADCKEGSALNDGESQ